MLTDHTYIQPVQVLIPLDLEQLYSWLIDKLRKSSAPLSMGEVLTKNRSLTGEQKNPKARESICRDRLRRRLEKFYANQFIFITPSRREGTFVALNDTEHYVRQAIRTTREDKEVIEVRRISNYD